MGNPPGTALVAIGDPVDRTIAPTYAMTWAPSTPSPYALTNSGKLREHGCRPLI
jgi:hypothetical protein